MHEAHLRIISLLFQAQTYTNSDLGKVGDGPHAIKIRGGTEPAIQPSLNKTALKC